jgi:hypothetical protein
MMTKLSAMQNAVLLSAMLILAHSIALKAAPPSGTGATADCCSAQALKTTASSLGFVDVVGVKLGMSPEQATAAIRASSPGLKIDVISTFIEQPGGPQLKVPHFLVAHTVNPRIVGGPGGFNQPDASSEEIVMEFTTPPNPPMVGKVTRVVIFPSGQPVLATTLLDAMRHKYGEENFADGVSRDWIFDASGKLLSRTVSNEERACLPQSTTLGFPNGLLPTADDVIRGVGGNITLATTAMNEASTGLMIPERRAICRAFTIVEAYGIGENAAPNMKMTKIDVTMQSPALLHNSQQATHDWLQSKADAISNKQNVDAAGRAPPKL